MAGMVFKVGRVTHFKYIRECLLLRSEDRPCDYLIISVFDCLIANATVQAPM